MASIIKAALPLLGLLGATLLVGGGIVLLARAGESPTAMPQVGVAEKTAPAETTAPAKDAASAGIPPIDAAAPADVETATFALG